MNKLIPMITCLVLLTGCTGTQEHMEVTDSVKEETESVLHDEKTDFEETKVIDTDEPEVMRIDLTGALSDIDEMCRLVPAVESSEVGMHSRWLQTIDRDCGYGTFFNSSVVGDFWIENPAYEVYGIYAGETVQDAREHLLNTGWSQDAQNMDKFTGYDRVLTLRENAGTVENIMIYLDEAHMVEADDSYFFPDSLDVRIDVSQLYGMSARDLTLARNEVFARYGYTFQRQDLQEYFNTKSWYKADPAVNQDTIGNYVSAIGWENMVLIRDYQEANGLTY